MTLPLLYGKLNPNGILNALISNQDSREFNIARIGVCYATSRRFYIPWEGVIMLLYANY